MKMNARTSKKFENANNRWDKNHSANEAYSASLLKIFDSYINYSDQKGALTSEYVPDELKMALIDAIENSSQREINAIIITCMDVETFSKEHLLWQGLAVQIIENTIIASNNSPIISDVFGMFCRRSTRITERDISMFICKSQYNRSRDEYVGRSSSYVKKLFDFTNGNYQPNFTNSIFMYSMENLTRNIMSSFFDYFMENIHFFVTRTMSHELNEDDSQSQKRIISEFFSNRSKRYDWKSKLKALNKKHDIFNNDNKSSRSSSTSLDTIIDVYNVEPHLPKHHDINNQDFITEAIIESENNLEFTDEIEKIYNDNCDESYQCIDEHTNDICIEDEESSILNTFDDDNAENDGFRVFNDESNVMKCNDTDNQDFNTEEIYNDSCDESHQCNNENANKIRIEEDKSGVLDTFNDDNEKSNVSKHYDMNNQDFNTEKIFIDISYGSYQRDNENTSNLRVQENESSILNTFHDDNVNTDVFRIVNEESKVLKHNHVDNRTFNNEYTTKLENNFDIIEVFEQIYNDGCGESSQCVNDDTSNICTEEKESSISK